MIDIEAYSFDVSLPSSLLRPGYLTTPLTSYIGEVEPLFSSEDNDKVIAALDRFITTTPARRLPETNVIYWLIYCFNCAIEHKDRIQANKIYKIFCKRPLTDPSFLGYSFLIGKHQGKNALSVFTDILEIATIYLRIDDNVVIDELSIDLVDYITSLVTTTLKDQRELFFSSTQLQFTSSLLEKFAQALIRTTYEKNNTLPSYCISHFISQYFAILQTDRVNCNLRNEIHTNSSILHALATALTQTVFHSDQQTCNHLINVFHSIVTSTSTDLTALTTNTPTGLSPLPLILRALLVASHNKENEDTIQKITTLLDKIRIINPLQFETVITQTMPTSLLGSPETPQHAIFWLAKTIATGVEHNIRIYPIVKMMNEILENLTPDIIQSLTQSISAFPGQKAISALAMLKSLTGKITDTATQDSFEELSKKLARVEAIVGTTQAENMIAYGYRKTPPKLEIPPLTSREHPSAPASP